MPFLVGDDSGYVKRVHREKVEDSYTLVAGEDLVGGSKGKHRAVQRMAFEPTNRLVS
jgi:hypothetical protein